MDQKTVSVLLIEDNLDDAFMAEDALRSSTHSFQVKHVVRMSDALQALHESAYDIILLDLALPDGFGLECYHQIHDSFSSIPIIILTGHKDEQTAFQSVQTGAQDYIHKDFSDPNMLVRSVLFGIERHKHWQSFRNMSLIDELTGLHNRRGFFTLGDQLVKMMKRSDDQVFIVFFDLDNMKTINDTFGHAIGDEALKQTAQTLRNTFRESDVIARLGGDEFAVVAVISNQYNEDILLSRFQENIARFNRNNEHNFQLSVSTGIVLVEKDSSVSIEDWLHKADQLMYQEKIKKKERWKSSS